MNIPIWFWYIVGAVIVLFMVLNVAGAIFGFRRWKQMDADFNQQRERVRKNLRTGARRT